MPATLYLAMADGGGRIFGRLGAGGRREVRRILPHATVHARVNIALSEAVLMGAAVGARAVGCGKRRA